MIVSDKTQTNRRETKMGYYQNLIIARQVEEPDRPVNARRRTTWQGNNDVVTDKRTLVFLLGTSMFFAVTTIGLVIVIAWIA